MVKRIDLKKNVLTFKKNSKSRAGTVQVFSHITYNFTYIHWNLPQ